METREKITLIIADDHTLVRQTWSFILNSDSRFKVIGECANGQEVIEMAKNMRPNVVIMDINLGVIDGIEATKQVRKFSPGSKVLAVSMHTQPAYVRKMIRSGASGYVTKNSTREEMTAAIEEVRAGRRYICNEIKNILYDQMMNPGVAEAGINSLSAREIEIIEKIRTGQSSKEIASELSLSVKTVEVHRYNILKKLKLRNSAALINFINNSALNFTGS